MPEPIFMKLGLYIMEPEPISMAYFINSSHQSVSVCLSPLPLLGNSSVNTFPRQRIYEKIEFLEASFSMRSLLYQRRVCGSVYSPIVARQRLSKHVTVATMNCWRRRFLCEPWLIKWKQVISSSQNFI
jgi:hypothetical protein